MDINDIVIAGALLKRIHVDALIESARPLEKQKKRFVFPLTEYEVKALNQCKISLHEIATGISYVMEWA